jgi:hypothetical protein
LSDVEDKATAEALALRCVAHHEAGHAVAAIWLRVPFRWVSIKPKAGSAGRVSGPSPLARLLEKHAGGDDLTPREWVRIESEVVILCAGVAAERGYLQRNGLFSVDSDADLAFTGVFDRSMNVDMAARLHGDDPEVADAWLRYLGLRASSLVRWQWKGVERVAAELLKRRTLSAKDVRAAYLASFKPSPGSVFYKPDDT